MSWWLKSRRASLLGLSVAATAALTALLGGTVIPTPAILRAGSASIAGVVLIPLVVNCVLQFSREGVDLRIERTAARSVRVFDLMIPAALAGALAAVGSLIATAQGAVGVEFARNGIGYFGIGLLVARVGGPRLGAAGPAVYIFVVALFASGVNAQRDLLSWPLHEGRSIGAAVVCGILFAGGLMSTYRGDAIGRVGWR